MITQRLSCLLICLISNACISQSLVVDAAHKDIIVFQFRDKRVNLLNTQDVVQVYKTDTFIIATQRWHPPGREYFNDGLEYLETQYSFLNGSDTMNISCQCPQGDNMFVQYIHFKKGQFRLNFRPLQKWDISSKTITTDEKIKSILFKNAYTPWSQGSLPSYVRQDIRFEKMRFILVDSEQTNAITSERPGDRQPPVVPIVEDSLSKQPMSVNAENKDILVFRFDKKNIQLLNDTYSTQVYKTTGLALIVALQKWADYGGDYFEKVYSFSNEKDTMTIVCNCGQERHMFFTNLHFKKGDFKLNVGKHEWPMVDAKDIGSDKQLNALIFRNVRTRWNDQPTYPYTRDETFERMKFYVINLKDKEHTLTKKE